jgi:hypothetical protein
MKDLYTDLQDVEVILLEEAQDTEQA